MATIANQYDPNDPNANQNTGGGGTVMPATSSSAPASGGAGYNAGAGALNRPTPSGTPNVQQYLNANQGAGQQLTQGITNTVQNQANQVNQGINQAQNTLNAQYEPLQQNLGSGGQQTIQTAFKDPQSLLDSYNAAKSQTATSAPLTSDQQTGANQYNQFQNLNTGGYNQGIQNYNTAGQQQYNQIQNQVGNLNQVTGSANNEMGRNQLLQQTVGQPNYNQGQQTLDALFLQGQPGGLNTLKNNLQGIQNGVNQNVNAATADTQSKLAALQGLSAQDQATIQNLFTNGGAGGTGLNQIASNVGNEYTQAVQNATNTDQGLQTAFKSNQYTPDQLKQLGLTPGQQTWGVDVAQAGQYHLNPLAAAANGGNAQVATPEEFARYNALNQLAGGPTGLQPNIFGSATTAGGYNPVAFDTTALQNAINIKKTGLMGEKLTNAVNSIYPALGVPKSGASFGGIGTGPRYDTSSESTLANQLQSGINAGTLTPDQANQYLQNAINGWVSNQHEDRNALNQLFQPFENYYQQEYLPAANAQIGTTDAIAQANPINSAGTQGKL